MNITRILLLAAAAWAAGLAAAFAAPLLDTFTVQPDDPRLLRRADLAIVDRPTPPGADAPWQAVTLPDLWRAEPRWRQGVAGWYRFRLPAGVPAEPQALYLWRFSMNAAVWFNGEELSRGGRFEEPVARHWNRPLLVDCHAGCGGPMGMAAATS